MALLQATLPLPQAHAIVQLHEDDIFVEVPCGFVAGYIAITTGTCYRTTT